MRTIHVLAAIVCAAFLGCEKTGPDECDAEDFGRQCGAGAGEYLKCGRTSCEDSFGLPCKEHTEVNSHQCPAERPTCVEDETSVELDIVCVGEDIGTCEQLGFLSCEDDQTVIECIADERGQLFSSRGACGENYRCLPPREFHAGGCTDLY